MNCKSCGKEMPNGARFCITCGAEHDSNGELIVKKSKIDYNKTVMATDISIQDNSAQKIDYNKTVMVNDVSRAKIDYNKTVMANDLPTNNSVDYNKTMMASDIPNNNFASNIRSQRNINDNVAPKKKNNLILIILLLAVVLAAVFFVITTKNKKAKQIEETSAVETTVSGNVVSDYDSSRGYWSKDAEFFYRDGSIQRNQWIGDYYVGNDGRKVRNSLIDDTYYVDANGQKVKNQWYKFSKKIRGIDTIVWYYLGEDGAKLTDTLTPDGYYVDENGIYIPGGEYNSPDSYRYTAEQN